jgi:phosphoglycolate phosphatase-like HAD superfamily hydrolase
MGLIRGVARTAAIAGTATAVSNRVSRRQGERWANEQDAAAYQEQQAYQQAPPPPPPAAPAPGTDDMLAQLKQLGDLHAAGVLTDEEFAVQKYKVMNP